MTDMATSLPEGKTATAKDGSRRMVVRGGIWINDDTYVANSRAKTAPQDRQALNNASARAATERDAQRTYAGASQAVDDMGTGPVRAWWLDAITPSEDDGGGTWGGLANKLADGLGVIAGTPFRALTSQRTLAARDHLKTVGAHVALAGSQQMKGSSSDKDTALMRMAGLGPYKTPEENHRIIRDASYSSGLEQTRALVTSNWINDHGSLSAPGANGWTHEKALQFAERRYGRHMQEARAPKLPKPPPSARKGPVTIDLDGNVIG